MDNMKVTEVIQEVKQKDQTHGTDSEYVLKKAVSIEGFICLILVGGVIWGLGQKMGVSNMFNTLLNTAFDLLMNTVFYIMAIAVVAGAFAGILTEFGGVAIINKVLSRLMKPLYDLPGASVLGILTTYFSDNPAILTLCKDKRFRQYFKKYQLPVLTNLGTAFGMGLIITVYMMGLQGVGSTLGMAVLIGNIAAVIGSIVSTRIMMHHTKARFGTEAWCETSSSTNLDLINYRQVRIGSFGERFMNAILEGGHSGVQMGFTIVPGVIIICSVVMILTNGPAADGIYTGAAYEGIALLPAIGEKLNFILQPLFGFSSVEAIAVPITALGAAGAAIGLIPNMIQEGLVQANDIAVFTAMCMCWSGYLSTHTAMMDGLKCRELTGKAILSHTVGGLCAGITANWLFKCVLLFII